MIMPHFDKTVFEVEGLRDNDPVEEVRVYELHLAENLILGLFRWPKGWAKTWGWFPELFRQDGLVLHAGLISFGVGRRVVRTGRDY